MFDRSKLESLCDVSVTTIGYALSYGFPQTDLAESSYLVRNIYFRNSVSEWMIPTTCMSNDGGCMLIYDI